VLALTTARDKFDEKIDVALIDGSMARRQKHAGSDIDLMVVGRLQRIDLLPILRKLENRLRREVTSLCFNPKSFSEGGQQGTRRNNGGSGTWPPGVVCQRLL